MAFFGRRASAGHVANVAERRLDWHGESGSTQSFKSHRRCIKQSGQRNLGFQDKHHLRFFKMPGRDRKKRQWVFSDAHRERKKFCGFKKPISDAVYPEIDGMSGFDKGAREVLDRFRDRRRATLRIPNRRTFTQCTDEKVGFNGVVYRDVDGHLLRHRKLKVRGVPAAAYDRGRTLEVYTGHTTISVFGDDPARVLRMARAVVPVSAAGAPRLGGAGEASAARFASRANASGAAVKPRVLAKPSSATLRGGGCTR